MDSQLSSLASEKARLEELMDALYEELAGHNVTMDSPLVDNDGFPRSDIDVYRVRHIRSEIRRLRTDHKAVMSKISAGLEQAYAARRGQDDSETTDSAHSRQSAAASLKAFARIDAVAPSSPAEEAGLKAGDALLSFGSITRTNFSSLSDVAQVVEHSSERSVQLVVRRDGTPLRLLIRPRLWQGRGKLGCHIVPL